VTNGPDEASIRLIHVRRVQIDGMEMLRLMRCGEHFKNAPGEEGDDSAHGKEHAENTCGGHKCGVLG